MTLTTMNNGRESRLSNLRRKNNFKNQKIIKTKKIN